MSVSGLDRHQRHVCRQLGVRAAMLGLHHASELHYTQGPERWEGVAHRLDPRRGQFPKHADCSSFATWCVSIGLREVFHLRDIVNGDDWQGGYTGTLAQNGRRVQHLHNVLHCDLVLYGAGPTYDHVAVIVGHDNRTPLVVSNGSEAGPFLLPYNYRSDVGQIRRYI